MRGPMKVDKQKDIQMPDPPITGMYRVPSEQPNSCDQSTLIDVQWEAAKGAG
jgi:hypothetical protein